MMRNGGGLMLLRGFLGWQVVVDNHTGDDSLRCEGWDPSKWSMHGEELCHSLLLKHAERHLIT